MAHIVEGDFDLKDYYDTELMPLVQEIGHKASKMGIAYVMAFQIGAANHNCHHAFMTNNMDNQEGVREYISDLIVALHLITQVQEAKEVQAFQFFACLQKRAMLREVREAASGYTPTDDPASDAP